MKWAGAAQQLSHWVQAQGGSVGIAVGNAAAKGRLLGLNAEAPLNPASNMKLVTAAAALDVLGPDYRYTTGLYGEVDDRGRVKELVLRGHGDPSLTQSDLWRLASGLAERGVQEVGELYVDQTRFDDQFVPPAFEQQPEEWAAFRAPVSAIAVERNTITLNVLPATPGQPARVWFTPRSLVSARGVIETRRAGSGQAISLEVKSASQQLSAELSGHVAAGLPLSRFSRRVDDPRLLAGLVLSQLLRDVGIKTTGSVSLGAPPTTERLVSVLSPPLEVLIRELGKHSDNFYAEMLFKTLATQTATPATASAAASVVEHWLAEVGTCGPGTRLVNGSGLFDANRLSAATLLNVLQHAYANLSLRHVYVDHLASGGREGTLSSRFRNPNQKRQVRAKTGTLNSVLALSGYVFSEQEPPRAFSIIVNGIAGKHAAVRARIDQFVEMLAGVL